MFFFSSRRRHTRWPRDWSSDVCSSDLFLPNLLTAGNLFCGFLALTKIVEANPDANNFNSTIRHALFLILLVCIFDLFDGRVDRKSVVEGKSDELREGQRSHE